MSSGIHGIPSSIGTRSPTLPRTPGLVLGPFYPLAAGGRPHDVSGLLWRGHAIPADAKRLVLEGVVRNQAGAAVVDADVELWHADPVGRYAHASAPENDRVLPGFVGYGRVHSAADGRFEFQTLVPGAYAEGEVHRAPHLHVQITGRFDRLVTQLFFAGHPLNARDRWFSVSRHPERLCADVLSDKPDCLTLAWIAVLRRG